MTCTVVINRLVGGGGGGLNIFCQIFDFQEVFLAKGLFFCKMWTLEGSMAKVMHSDTITLCIPISISLKCWLCRNPEVVSFHSFCDTVIFSCLCRLVSSESKTI